MRSRLILSANWKREITLLFKRFTHSEARLQREETYGGLSTCFKISYYTCARLTEHPSTHIAEIRRSKVGNPSEEEFC